MKNQSFSPQQMLDHIDRIGGVENILEEGQLKIEKSSIKPLYGQESLRVTGTLHLNILSPEIYAFCKSAFGRVQDIKIDYSEDKNKGICNAYIVKEFGGRFLANESEIEKTTTLIRNLFIKTINKEIEVMREAVLNSEVLTQEAAEENQKTPFPANETAKTRFFKRVLSKFSDPTPGSDM